MQIGYRLRLTNKSWRGPSRTKPGRRSTSSMRKDVSAIIFGEGSYDSRRWSSRRYCERPGRPASARPVRSMPGPRAAPTRPSEISRKLSRSRAHRELCLTGRRVVGHVRDCIERPARLGLNEWALSGDWTVREGAAGSEQSGGSLRIAFTPATFTSSWSGNAWVSVKFRVLIDGQPRGSAHGVDVDEQGYGTVWTADTRCPATRPIADRQSKSSSGSGAGDLRLPFG